MAAAINRPDASRPKSPDVRSQELDRRLEPAGLGEEAEQPLRIDAEFAKIVLLEFGIGVRVNRTGGDDPAVDALNLSNAEVAIAVRARRPFR